MHIGIKKRKLYITPTPKKDIEGGLVLQMNKPINEKFEPYVSTNVEAGRRIYNLPELPEGIWIVSAFIRERIKTETKTK